MKKIFPLLSILAMSISSCGPTPWPDDFAERTVNTFQANPNHFVNILVGSNELKDYVGCLTNQAKVNYPNYDDFLEENDDERKRYIDALSIDCMHSVGEISFDRIITLVNKTESFKQASEFLTPQEIKLYTKMFKSELIKRFGTVQNFMTKTYLNETEMNEVFTDIDMKCGEIILAQRETADLLRLNSLITYENGQGVVNFRNNRSTEVSGIKLVYHYQGNKWAGWVSIGAWDLKSLEERRIPIPLSNDGTIGRTLYYIATSFNDDGILLGWTGYGSFLTTDTKNYQIPYADSDKMKKINKAYYFEKQFREIYVGQFDKEVTIDFN